MLDLIIRLIAIIGAFFALSSYGIEYYQNGNEPSGMSILLWVIIGVIWTISNGMNQDKGKK